MPSRVISKSLLPSLRFVMSLRSTVQRSSSKNHLKRLGRWGSPIESMDREVNAKLENAIAEIQSIANRIEDALINAEGELRADLIDLQVRPKAAARYHGYLLSRPNRDNVPAVATRVGVAACGAGLVGMVPPHYLNG